jgi:8-oxo-dGTP pyrophosphatase MutT (NUDIX family)
MSSDPSHPSRWQRLSQRSQLQTRIFDVVGALYRHPARSTEREFVVINAPDWVNVVALTPDGKIVLVRQFRYGIDEFSLEVPGGVIDSGEDPVVAGMRELREETGFSGAPAKLLGTVFPNPAMQSNRCHFVFVENVVKLHDLAWDPDEELQVETLPADDVLAMAHSGGIVHSLVLNALMLFEPYWRAWQKG